MLMKWVWSDDPPQTCIRPFLRPYPDQNLLPVVNNHVYQPIDYNPLDSNSAITITTTIIVLIITTTQLQ